MLLIATHQIKSERVSVCQAPVNKSPVDLYRIQNKQAIKVASTDVGIIIHHLLLNLAAIASREWPANKMPLITIGLNPIMVYSRYMSPAPMQKAIPTTRVRNATLSSNEEYDFILLIMDLLLKKLPELDSNQ